jgi:dipeptide/tripeptide permease
MKAIKKLGYLLSLLGLIMYLPPVVEWLTLHFGETIGHFSGIVSFAVGWAVLGASFAFSAGFKYQHERIKKKIQ